MANGDEEKEMSAEQILARVIGAQAAAKKQAQQKKPASSLDQYWSTGAPKAKDPVTPGLLETAVDAFAHEMGVGDTKEAGEALGKAAASSLQQFLAQGAPASENPQEKPFSQRAAETVETVKTMGAELAKWGTIFAAAAGVNTHKQKGAGASAHSEASAAESSSAPKQLSGEILEGEFKEL